MIQPEHKSAKRGEASVHTMVQEKRKKLAQKFISPRWPSMFREFTGLKLSIHWAPIPPLAWPEVLGAQDVAQGRVAPLDRDRFTRHGKPPNEHGRPSARLHRNHRQVTRHRNGPLGVPVGQIGCCDLHHASHGRRHRVIGAAALARRPRSPKIAG